jgi:hypothetical protein
MNNTMEKFLKSKGIDVVVDYSQDTFEPCYAYTHDLLDKNILIEFYNFETDPNPDTYEVETTVFVLLIKDSVSYYFTLFYEIGIAPAAPIQVFRVITDLVDYIKICDANTLVDDLNAIAKGVTSSLDAEAQGDQQGTYELDLVKFQYIRDLIEQKRNGMN